MDGEKIRNALGFEFGIREAKKTLGCTTTVPFYFGFISDDAARAALLYNLQIAQIDGEQLQSNLVQFA